MRVLVALAIASVFFFLMIRLMEPRFVFFPLKYPNGFWDVDTTRFQIEDHYFTTPDGVQLHGWFWPKKDPLATILLFHGNAGNLSHRLDLMERLRNALDSEIFIFDYRGYGRSQGHPSESGIYADGQAAYRYLVEQLNKSPRQLILLGRSLGGVVAVDLAQSVEPAGIILESTFTNARDMARRMFGFIPVWWFMSIKFQSDVKIQNIRVPKLFIHGTRDEVVPMELGKKLYELAPPPKTFVAIQGANHNDIYITGGSTYYQAMREFIERCIQPEGGALAEE